MKIIPELLLEDYKKNFPLGLEEKFDSLHDADISAGTFSFYTSVASVFSSKIEGEEMELDSYIKYKKFGILTRVVFNFKSNCCKSKLTSWKH